MSKKRFQISIIAAKTLKAVAVFGCLLIVNIETSLGMQANEQTSSPKNASRPNIIFMMTDDQGWSGLSVAMHPNFDGSRNGLVETPNLEKLASQGMRFSSAYSPASVCSPTRMSLMNGRSPAANGWTKAGGSVKARTNPKLLPPESKKTLPKDQVTIGEALQSAGYATAHFGKWHLGSGGPGVHGFDAHDGETGNAEASQFNDPENPVDIFGMCDRAEKFMKQNKEAKKPFFMVLNWYALHGPQNASPASKAKYEKQGMSDKQLGVLALTQDVDNGVGRIMKSLDSLGLADNTFLIYTSDNGSGNRRGNRRRTQGLSGGKGSVWEGGIRVPLIIRGPGVARNSWCHETTVGYDFYPTFCELAGVKELPKSTTSKLEGGSITQLLKNSGKGEIKRAMPNLVFHFPHYQSEDGPHSAIISGNLKLIYFYESKTSKLFDLSKDIAEQNDLASSQSSKTKALEKELGDHLRQIKAALPVPNPNYDASQPSDTNRRQNRGNRGRRGGRSRGNG